MREPSADSYAPSLYRSARGPGLSKETQRGSAQRKETRTRSARPGKAHIRFAALQEMSEFGYHGTSVRGIARRAGVSLAALYRHYESKYDLLAKECLSAYRINLADLQHALAHAPDDPRQRLLILVDAHIRPHIADENGRITAVVVHREYRRLHAEERAEITKLRLVRRNLFEGVLREGASQGIFAVSDLEGVAGAILTLGANAILWVEAEPALSVDEIVRIHHGFALALARCAE